MTPHHPFRKLAFFVHTAEMFNHYQPVWRLLGADGFDIVLHGNDKDRAESRSLADRLGYRCHDFTAVIQAGYQYDVLVSNHNMIRFEKRLLNQLLAHRQVRFMYALGKGRHNFSEWNQDYDLILCYGPWQAEQLRACSDAVIFQMGYPRYDDYFRFPERQNERPADLSLDPGKETVLWLPTWQELSSISRFADSMSTLCDRYNVIVKTHPLSVNAEPETLAILQQYAFTAVITHVYDNLNLFRCADYVVSDYGGTAFGAIYLDKKLLLLNVPDADQDSLTGEASPDVLLRQDIVNLDMDARWQLPEVLADEAIWSAQTATRERLRRRHFAPTYGFSAELATLALQHIDTLLKQG
ncbi:MAG TPA: CDP-glycerol glycerophosphotransferase family protein [Herbaspirillum sp.]|jgi:hypothetical protein